jgi:hypothetical protein
VASEVTLDYGSPGSLGGWIAAHGPLAPRPACMIATEACARAAMLSRSQLQSTIGSLRTDTIIRDETGSWSWVPAPAAPTRHATDADLIERVGAILFECLTGQRPTWQFPSESAVRQALRAHRPDLPPHLSAAVIRALSIRTGAGLTLAAFVNEVRHAVGLDDHSSMPGRRYGVLIAAPILAVIGVAVALTWITRGDSGVGTHGLAEQETIALDILTEAAHTFAVTDEHTAAIQRQQQIERLWRTHVSPRDPRPLWGLAHEAWIRTLAGDRTTTEQVLASPTVFAASFGEHHPYTRAVLLELAATLEARGLSAEGATLRDQAARAAHALVPDGTPLMTGIPAPPGVVAHVDQHSPEGEGFRSDRHGGFFLPLTSAQRWIAGRDGWRLHLIAGGECHASAVVGSIPHRVGLDASRTAGTGWRLRVEGTQPPLTLDVAGEHAGVSLIADGSGGVVVRLADGRAQSARIDAAAPPPVPPYTLTFARGGDASGCSLVWLEIPFPFEPKS